jgi:hypothetical protein
MNSSPLHYMEVSGQLQSPTAYTLRLPQGRKLRWTELSTLSLIIRLTGGPRIFVI